MLRTRLPTIPLSAQGFAKYLTVPGQFFFSPCEFQIPNGEWMLLDFTLSDMIGGPGGLKRTQQLEDGTYKVELCAISFTRNDQDRVLGGLILPALQFVLDEYDNKGTGAIVFVQEEALPCALNVLRSIAYSFPDVAEGIEQACSELQKLAGLSSTQSDQVESPADVPDAKRVFISYNHRDRDFVDRLAHDLRAVGLRVWWDEWEIKVGHSIVQKVSEGIEQSAYLIVVLSPNSVYSDWVKRELDSALMKQLSADRGITILPVLMADCEIPRLLSEVKWADFRLDYDKGLRDLVEAVQPISVSPVMQQAAPSITGKKWLAFLRDPIWQAIGGIVAIIALAVTVWTIWPRPQTVPLVTPTAISTPSGVTGVGSVMTGTATPSPSPTQQRRSASPNANPTSSPATISMPADVSGAGRPAVSDTATLSPLATSTPDGALILGRAIATELAQTRTARTATKVLTVVGDTTQSYGTAYVAVEVFIDQNGDGLVDPDNEPHYVASDFEVLLRVEVDNGLEEQVLRIRDSDDGGQIDGKGRAEIAGNFYAVHVSYSGGIQLADGYRDVSNICLGCTDSALLYHDTSATIRLLLAEQ